MGLPMDGFLSTPQGIGLVSAMVGAGAAILGQITSGAISFVKDTHLEKKRSERRARHSATEAIVSLADFVNSCHNVACGDKLNIAPDDPFDAQFEVDLPNLDSINIIAMDALDPALAVDLLWLKSELQYATAALESLNLVPPNYDHAQDRRSESFSRLGLQAIRLMERMSALYRVYPPAHPNYYNPKAELSLKLEESMSRLFASQG